MSKISEIINSKKHYEGMTLIERMEECHTQAISISIIENYKISEVYTYGVKQRRTKEEVTPETLFQAGSISKPVFAVGVLRLVELGILDLDVDVTEYLSNYNVPTYDNQKHELTLRQILSHHAGLNIHGFAGYQQGQRIPSIEQILKGTFPSNHMKLKLLRNPETKFQYSGGGYVLAQKVISDVCRSNFCDLMNRLVLIPFTMTNSTYSQPLASDKSKQVAFGYNHHNLQIPGGYNIMPELSAAGLWSTPSDLAQFGIEIMKALKKESMYLSESSAKLMTTKAYENSPYGLGFAISQSNKGAVFGHSGSNFGFHSNMCFCPDKGSGFVVMLNSDIGRRICSESTKAFKEIYNW